MTVEILMRKTHMFTAIPARTEKKAWPISLSRTALLEALRLNFPEKQKSIFSAKTTNFPPLKAKKQAEN